MPTYNTPKKNTAYRFYVGLTDQANTKLLRAAPTLATGDVKVSIDGGALNNVATLPSAAPAGGRSIQVDLSAAEMNGDNIVVQFVDAAGAEWCDQLINLQTTARQIDDLAYPATTGRSMLVDATGGVSTSSPLKKGQALSNFRFVMTDSTNHNPVTGKTVSATRGIDSGAHASGTLSAVTEIANGEYRVDLGTGDTNGNVVALRFTAAGCDDLVITLLPQQ